MASIDEMARENEFRGRIVEIATANKAQLEMSALIPTVH